MLHGLLVIERSATLRHLLERTLAAGQLPVEHSSGQFQDGLKAFNASLAEGKPFSGVVVGAPQKIGAGFEKFLSFFGSEQSQQIPLLVVGHDKAEPIESLLGDRDRTDFVLWPHFGRIPGVLRKLLPTEQARPTVRVAEPPQSAVRILFIDDSRSVRYAYRQLLEHNGFEVETAGTKAEALKTAAEQKFDLIIIDYFLPDGNGEEICRALGKMEGMADVSRAIITGSYRESVIKKCLEAGATECMFKNEAKELFLARVKAIARTIETQKSVESERQRLNGILGSVGDGVYGVDGSGLVTFVNPVGLRLLGIDDEDQVVGEPAFDAIHPTDRNGQVADQEHCLLQQSYLDGSELERYETVFKRTDGDLVPVECTAFPLSIQDKRQGSVVVFRDISERKSADQMRWEVFHDSLTKLGNRRYFGQQLEQALIGLQEKGGYGALLYIDIDRFTHIVEGSGQSAADSVLADVAEQLSTRLRDGDVLARLEADKFALLLKGIQLSNLFTIADTYRDDLHACRYEMKGEKRDVAGSIGVVILSNQTPSAEYALEHARVACQLAKKKGRDQTHIYVADDDARIRRELEAGWADRFREALREDRFVLLAQPISPVAGMDSDRFKTDVEDNWLLTRNDDGPAEFMFELLIRLVSRDGEWVSPAVFVPLAERVNLIQDIDRWVIKQVLKTLSANQGNTNSLAFTVNLSNTTLQDPEALPLISDLFKASDADPTRVIFEITETSEMGNIHTARRFIQALKKIGVRFALDDFGTGFSSFSHLKHLPVDFIKIDGMFVESMISSDVDRTMVSSIASMATSLSLRTIAEHVDSAATFEAVRDCDVDFAQGHFLGEPKRLDEMDFGFLD